MQFGRKKTLIDRAQEYVDQISETVLPQLEAAWEQAVDKAGPALSDARDKATPLLAEGRAIATEKASAGAALAAERASAGAHLAADKASAGAAVAAALAADKASAGRDLASAKVASFRPEPEPKGGKLKKVLLFGGLLAIAGVVANKLRSSQNESANWQSSYVPTPPPAPSSPAASTAGAAGAGAATAATPVTGDPHTDPLPGDVTADDVVTVDPPTTDDIGGGAPGEALSDVSEEPHEATTPDDPAEIIDIDDVPHK